MAIEQTHPYYDGYIDVWRMLRLSYEGQPAIKGATSEYLPATSGQILDGYGTVPNSIGEKSYAAYLIRAIYPELLAEAVDRFVGKMHRKPPELIELGALESLREDATARNETLELLLRRINTAQMKTGRVGILGDIVVTEDKQAKPRICLYSESAIRNWDDAVIHKDTLQHKLIVLDESGYVMSDDLSWDYKERYRVLAMCIQDGDRLVPDPEGTIYATAIVNEGEEYKAAEFTAPTVRGKTLEHIPFVFINRADLSSEPDKAPLLSLAELCLAIYRGEADYRTNLFMQGQDTLVEKGAQDDDPDKPRRTGAGSRIQLSSDGDAKYIGVNSKGLPEQREALQADYKRAEAMAGQITTGGNSKEAAETLNLRIEGQTVGITQVVAAGAAGLERLIRLMAPWFNQEPNAIEINPNREFNNRIIDVTPLKDLIAAKALGAKISDESIHKYMVENGFTTLSFEDELELLAKEESSVENDVDNDDEDALDDTVENDDEDESESDDDVDDENS